ncbi:cupin domain-containing protein [Saccharibacillus sp. JS10]|uniref:cupin domain-containing protein n=1 Tax=Saccharibacillus sp. JS10 TaxID=2950552 RepID=UPI00210C4B84|nr:cupin domain-containing protein [Saccharibacillus sp. JS10]MCQ4088404.1 cupin domain-containing protein [Saccharibacillus sp. JS10]
MISKQNAEHYIWGNNCDGWRLVNEEGRSIIHEKMPPDTSEARHFHQYSKQFFFVLSGTMVFELDGVEHILNQQEGIEVPPTVPHQAMNQSDKDLEFLVISQPNTQNDRVLTE